MWWPREVEVGMVENGAYAKNVVSAKLYGLVGSPIELVLGNALFDLLSTFYENWWCRVYSVDELMALDPQGKKLNGGSIVALVPQLPVQNVGWVNFALIIPQLMDYGPMVIVECDGHEFHDRTSEQASRDRRRDRVLTALGAPVLRFTGSDILRDAAGAAAEISDVFADRVLAAIDRWNREIGDELNKTAKGGFYVPFQWPPDASRPEMISA